MWTQIIFLSLVASVYSVGPFEKCDADNLTDLNSCLTKTFNEKLNSVITSGFPEWGLAPVDPWNYKTNIPYQIGDFSNIGSDMQLRGISKLNNILVVFNPSTMTVHWKGSIPEFRVTGQYKLSGQLFALKLEGQGPFWTILSNVTSEIEQKLAINKDTGLIQVESDTINLNYNKFRSRMNKLFNGDLILGETVNAFVNENSFEIVEIFKPAIAEPIRALLNEVIVRVLNDISIDKLLRIEP